jgi:hypothetical protein
VLARDISTGQQRLLDLTSAVDVSDEAVEQMIAESVDHAFEDMSETGAHHNRIMDRRLGRAGAKT